MYPFIKKESSAVPVSKEQLAQLEQEGGFRIPAVLRDYWLTCNGADIQPCEFRVRTERALYDCCITEILTVGYGKYDFAYYLAAARRNPQMPGNLIPFALDEAGDKFCWDRADGSVFYVKADEEDPIPVSKDVETFFSLLRSGGETTAPAEKPDEKASGKASPVQTGREADVLRFRGRSSILLISLCVTLASLVLIPVTDGLSLIFTGVLGAWTVIYLGIWMSHMISSRTAVEKYGKENLLKELSAPGTEKVEGIDTYLTEHVIISNHKRVAVTKYSDIAWIHPTKLRGVGSLTAKAGAAAVNAATGSPIRAWLKNGKAVTCAVAKDTNQIKAVFDRVIRENREVLVGYSPENQEKYKQSCPGYRRRKILEWLLIGMAVAAVFLLQRFVFPAG